MGNKSERVMTQMRPDSRVTRNKKQRYSKEVFGARVPHEDARILDDYGKLHKLERSDVVRVAIHQFALRQQMSYHKKDPLRETMEQAVAAQIAPIHNRIEEMAAMFHHLAQAFVQTQQTLAVPSSAGASTAHEELGVAYQQTHDFKEQKQLLEKTLMAAMLALRLHVNYVVEPILREANESASGEAQAYLQGATQGRDMWSEITREVITRTGNRILFELNLITKEDWEKLLQVYSSHES